MTSRNAPNKQQTGGPMDSVKVIVLDLDNTVVLDPVTGTGSEDIKDEAYFQVFNEHSREALEPVFKKVFDLIKGGKGDRRDVMRFVLDHFQMCTPDKLKEEVEKRCAAFDEYMQSEILKIKIPQETREALDILSRAMPLYINTANPTPSAQRSLENLHLLRYFRGVLGRHGTKAGNILEIAKKESVLPKQILFVDDQHVSWELAQEIGCQFVGVRTLRNKTWHTGKHPFHIIRSIDRLIPLLS